MTSHNRARRWRWRIAVGLAALGLILAAGRCTPSVRVASFNIRMFPEPRTDADAVAAAIAELDADVLGVQEIRSASELARVLADASARTGRDYHATLSRCQHPQLGITTGLVWDASTWRVVATRDYPRLLPDDGGACGPSQPGIAGVFEHDDGRRVAVLSVHLDPYVRGFDARRRQWRLVLAIQNALEAEFDAPVLAVGDFNSTGFSGRPEGEPEFIRDVVDEAGYTLLSRDLQCTEYYRPSTSSLYLPSLLDHVVASGGAWSPARVHGMCERLRCRRTQPDDMDPDFFDVSDHCPIVVEGDPVG